MYLDESDHMRTFHNLIIHHTAVAILIGVEAVDKVAILLPGHIAIYRLLL